MKINKRAVLFLMLTNNVDNQKKLAQKTGLSVNTVSNVMRGATAQHDTVKKIAAALNCKPCDIVQVPEG